MTAKVHKIIDVSQVYNNGCCNVKEKELGLTVQQMTAEQIVEEFGLHQDAAEIERLIGNNSVSYVAINPYKNQVQGKRILMIKSEFETLDQSYLEQRRRLMSQKVTIMKKRLIYREEMPEINRYDDDLEIMRKVLSNEDYEVSDADLVRAWQDYSETSAANWLMLPDDEDVLLSILLNYLVEE